MTMIGAGLLWVGWFGFNAGSSVSSGLLTAQALTATQVAAAAGAMAWIIIEALHQGKATALGFASGILAGLVAVTPAAGVVQPAGAMALGIAAALICYTAIMVKTNLVMTTALMLLVYMVSGEWSVHCFLYSSSVNPGWQVPLSSSRRNLDCMATTGVQATAVGIAVVYAAIMTLVIIFMVNKWLVSGLQQKKKCRDSITTIMVNRDMAC